MFVLELGAAFLFRGFHVLLSNLNELSAVALKVCQFGELDCDLETREWGILYP